MALKAVHHIALLVSDYQKSKEFYVDKLGFRIVRENFREDRGDYKLDLILNGVELEILLRHKKIMSISSIRQDRISRRHTGSDILPSQLQILKKQPQNSGKRELRQNLSG